jgi:uncharacterized protein (TIGR03067 family)
MPNDDQTASLFRSSGPVSPAWDGDGVSDGLLLDRFVQQWDQSAFGDLTHEVVARRLEWPIGTVRVRIARGRDLLRERLIRRGLTPAAVLLALSLLPRTEAAVPIPLVEATVRAATRVVTGEQGLREEVPMRVIDLEMKVRKAMRLTRLKWAAAVGLAVIVTGAGVAALPGALAAADDRAKVDSELKKLQGTWLIAAFEQAGVKKDANGKGELYKIKGESFEVWHNGHVEEKGTIRLDASKNPMVIDFQFKEGRKKG